MKTKALKLRQVRDLLAEGRQVRAAIEARLRPTQDPGFRCFNCVYLSAWEDRRTCDGAKDREIVTEFPPLWCPLRDVSCKHGKPPCRACIAKEESR